ncbi:restriction endonuclease subunit S [Lacticaseibacillus paracasei]|uniref:restriction endonuclease subunit S n=1 Tax=Lacticaseibacillus paracasei TaxID=1597 RepID=UPI0022E4664F|nr:restriction endonuclease subunit S [Lacticaseibacillus paracasei]
MSKDAKNVPALRFKGYSDAWEKRKLSYFLHVTEMKNKSEIFSKKDVLSVSGEFGIVNQIELQGRSFAGASVKNYGVVEPGDVVYTKSPLKKNPFGIVKVNRNKAGIVSTLYAIYKPQTTLYSPIIDYYFQSDCRVNNYLRPLVNKGAKNDMKVRNVDVLKGNVALPSEKDEQRTIVGLLSKLDNLIAATQHSIDALEQAKKALLQRLFDQSWRFKGYSDPWEKRKLGEVVERVTRKNRDLVSTRPLTISAQDGLVDQRKFFSKTVASKNISNYFLLKAGDFAYNKSYSVGYPWGAVKRLDKYPSGVLSTLYIVFKPKKINSQFLVTYFEGTTWYVSVSKVASEGARNHGLLNISASDFFDQQLFFPTKKTEQESIGLTIKVLDDLIAATQSRLSSLELLKKALLQDLFI